MNTFNILFNIINNKKNEELNSKIINKLGYIFSIVPEDEEFNNIKFKTAKTIIRIFTEKRKTILEHNFLSYETYVLRIIIKYFKYVENTKIEKDNENFTSKIKIKFSKDLKKEIEENELEDLLIEYYFEDINNVF